MSEMAIDGWGEASQVLTGLVGAWSLDRIIDGQGTMRGAAIFTASGASSLAYREQGRLKLLNGTELEAEREYLFSKTEKGIDVFFRETPPRLFHRVSLVVSDAGALFGEAGHLCNLDDYRSSYTFLPDGRFVVRHVVSGPRKDYTMTTAYARSS